MWGFVGKFGKKDNWRWLWHVIDHHTGAALAYVFSRRKNEGFLRLKALLKPFGLLATTQIIGARPRVTSTPTSTTRVNVSYAAHRAHASDVMNA